MLSSFYSYFTLTDTPTQRGPSPEDKEAIERAHRCFQECHVEQLIMESKFLRVESLQELLKVLLTHCLLNTYSGSVLLHACSMLTQGLTYSMLAQYLLKV